ncbi:hypothetical protein KVMX100_120583 [Klebsiella variicola]|nr:hypothetical protein KVMX100_120583 [Klebsiella variicola]
MPYGSRIYPVEINSPFGLNLFSFISMRISKTDEPVNSELKNIKLSRH